MCSGETKCSISRECKDLFVSQTAEQKSRGDLVSDTIPRLSCTHEGHLMS